MQEVDRLGWVVNVPLRAGSYVLGVRANSQAAADLLIELFADRHVPDAEPPGNLSVWLAPPSSDGTQDLHRVYETYTRALRTRSVTRVLGALWHELDARDTRIAGEQLLADVATLIDAQGRAHLLNAGWRRFIVDDERRWQRAGLQLVERRWVAIDLKAGTVSVPGVPAGFTEDALAPRVAALEVDHRAGQAVRGGTWPIATWTMQAQEHTLAQRVVLAAGALLDLRGSTGAAAVREVAELSAGLAEVSPGWSDLDDLRDLLAQTYSG